MSIIDIHPCNMTNQPDEFHATFHAAMEAFKRGDRDAARRLAQRAVALNPDDEGPWLILAALAGPVESLEYIQKALQINPTSKFALRALASALSKLESPPESEGFENIPSPPAASPTSSSLDDTQPVKLVVSPAPDQPSGVDDDIPATSAGAEASPPDFPETPRRFDLHRIASHLPALLEPLARPPARGWVLISLGVASFALLIVLVVLLFAQPASPTMAVIPTQPGLALSTQSANAASVPAATQSTTPTGPAPSATAQANTCQASLAVGTHIFVIEELKPGLFGGWSVPVDDQEHAYRLEGTQGREVFVLSPAQSNLDLASGVQAGDLATVTLADCNKATYGLAAAVTGKVGDQALLDQVAGGIGIFVAADNATEGPALLGLPQGEEITTFSTPDTDSLQAEISLLGIASAPDGATVTLELSIYNFGERALRLTKRDVWLTPDGAAEPLAVSASEPGLPLTVQAGSTEALRLTFPRPQTSEATLKIYTVEFIVDGY